MPGTDQCRSCGGGRAGHPMTASRTLAEHLRRAAAVEYRLVRDDTGAMVGVGVTEDRSTTHEDAAAWQRDGYAVTVERRSCGPWERVDRIEATP